MANTASAKKEMRKTKKRTLRNLTKKKVIKERMKAALEAIASGKDAQAAVTAAFKALDKAAKTNTIHPNKASRMKARLQKKLNAAKK